jgi:phage gpG-like protein
MLSLYVDDSAVKHLHRDLQRLALDIGGTNRMREPLLRVAREVLSPSIEENFRVGGRPKWARVDQGSTYRTGRRGGPPLDVTGTLKRAATAFARFQVRNNTMTYGNFPPSAWYAVVHDNAAISAKAGIPNRPFALIQKEDEPAIGRVFMEWLEDKVDQHVKRVYF